MHLESVCTSFLHIIGCGNAIKAMLACYVLHNFLLETERGCFELEPPNPAKDFQFMDLCSGSHDAPLTFKINLLIYSFPQRVECFDKMHMCS